MLPELHYAGVRPLSSTARPRCTVSAMAGLRDACSEVSPAKGHLHVPRQALDSTIHSRKRTPLVHLKLSQIHTRRLAVGHYITAACVASTSGASRPVYNPATGAVRAPCGAGSMRRDTAVAADNAAFPAWPRRRPPKKSFPPRPPPLASC